MNNVKFTDFPLDTIQTYLEENKIKLIDMGLGLDRYEISKSLTNSLNRMLMGNKTKLSDIYDYMMNNFDDVSNKIKLIEDKVRYFNSYEKFQYFVEPEKILYVVFFKQIIYIKKLIDEINNYVNSNINLVFIYSYLISKLYNEPNNITSNYIFIISKIISDDTFLSNYDDKFKKIISLEIINKVFAIIKIIYSADTDFVKLLTDLENKKMEAYKKNNTVDYSDSYKELEKEAKNIKGGDVNIYDIETNFQKTRDFMFVQKRKIDITLLYNIDNFNLIFQDGLSIELWFGYNLFVYKRFEFAFDEYMGKINEMLNSKGYKQIYMLSLNYLNDMNSPDAGIIPIKGGNNTTIDYYLKYIKYKNKYLKLKKI
jgi:hypothetical protein